MPRKVLLVVIDAAIPTSSARAARTGRLPTMRCLVGAGTMVEASISISVHLPAATASLVTSSYPFEQ